MSCFFKKNIQFSGRKSLKVFFFLPFAPFVSSDKHKLPTFVAVGEKLPNPTFPWEFQPPVLGKIEQSK